MERTSSLSTVLYIAPVGRSDSFSKTDNALSTGQKSWKTTASHMVSSSSFVDAVVDSVVVAVVVVVVVVLSCS